MNIESVQDKLIFKAVAGSHMYGLNTPESDTDYRGVFKIDASSYFTFNQRIEQASDEKQDITYYTIHRFLQLACAGNPNVLEYLWCPADCVVISSKEWREIQLIRDKFITKSVLDSFAGYSIAQIKKARGQNKLVNNPMPEKKPTKEDFCWVIPMDVSDPNDYGEHWCGYLLSKSKQEMPFRPTKLADSYIDLSYHHCSAVEHLHDTYRLYHYGKDAKGVFRGDDSADIVPTNIPIEDERNRFAGLLIYNKDAYERELKLWKQYWDWMKNRNNARWVDQENKKVDYDGKNMMHCMRLIISAENILEHGQPLVRPGAEVLAFLRDIRAGKLPYDKLVDEAERRIAKLDEARKTCSLPKNPCYDTVNELSIRLHKQLL